MSISEVIINRIKQENGKFHSNDNISKYILNDIELDVLQREVEQKMEEVLRTLVIDIDHDHNTKETARRVAKMWIKEIFGGRYQKEPKVTSFPNEGYKGLYTCGPISVRSTCAHHFQNIVGKCWIGVVPEEEVIGLSKFNRIVQHISERPQIQEEMTTQIADKLVEFAKTPNIAVVVKAEHHCMTHRGVKEHESEMVTAIMKGLFEQDNSLKLEFYNIIQNLKSY